MKYKDYELEVLLDNKSVVQVNPLFMGDYFYFHFDWTSLQNSRQRAVSVSSHNVFTTLVFRMKSNFDETLTSCSKYHYYQQQGLTFLQLMPNRTRAIITKISLHCRMLHRPFSFNGGNWFDMYYPWNLVYECFHEKRRFQGLHQFKR